MPDNPVEKVIANAGTKAHGVPVWVWAGVAVGGGLIVYYVFFRPSSVSTLPNTLGPLSGGMLGGGGGGGGSPTITPVTSDVPVTTNGEWLTKAIAAVTKQTGMDAAQVSLYLRQYLSGRMPVGSNTAANDFNRVVQAAIQTVGQPASQPPVADANTNPYLANSDWLANALGFLPSGLSGSAKQEIINLFQGRTTTISQAAADAIERARGILGYEPSLIPYTIASAAPIIPPKPDTPAPIIPPIVQPPIVPPIPVPIPPAPTPIPVNPAPAPTLATLNHINQLLTNATNAISQRLDVNQPDVYFPLYKTTFSWLDNQQIQAIQDTVHGMYANGAHPSNNALLAAINNVILQGIRHPVPSGANPNAALPAGVNIQIPALPNEPRRALPV